MQFVNVTPLTLGTHIWRHLGKTTDIRMQITTLSCIINGNVIYVIKKLHTEKIVSQMNADLFWKQSFESAVFEA